MFPSFVIFPPLEKGFLKQALQQAETETSSTHHGSR